MNSQTLQKLVRKIHSDEKTRARFVSDPEGVISQFKLTEEEKKVVLQTHFKLGLIGSDSSQLEAAIRPTTYWASPVP